MTVRVGFVALGGLGGSSRVAHDVAASLARDGAAVVSLTCGESQFGPEVSTWVQHVPVRAPRAPQPAEDAWVHALADDLELAVTEHGIDVLSVHYGVGLAEAAMLARMRLRERGLGLRVFVTLHGTDVTEHARDPGQARRLRLALRRADGVSAVSPWLSGLARERLVLPQPPQIIPNGIDLDVFRPNPAVRVVDPPVLVHASNFRPVKRPLDAIEVLHTLKRRGVDAALEMIGDGPLRGAARALSRELGVAGEVNFIDPLAQGELAARLRGASVSLVTSESESFGLFAVESMASGVPLAGWKSSGLLGTLRGDPGLGDALLVRRGDVERLADRVVAMLHDPAHHEGLARRCISLVRRRYARSGQLEDYRQFLGLGDEETRDWPHGATS